MRKFRFYRDSSDPQGSEIFSYPDDENMYPQVGAFIMMIMDAIRPNLADWWRKNNDSERPFTMTIYPEDNKIYINGADIFWGVVESED